MEFKDLQQQLTNLISMGYDKEHIIKIVENAPAIFRYTPEGIKTILNTLDKSNEPKLMDIDSVVFPKGLIKTDDKVVGYTMDVNDAQKIHIMDVIIDDENYPLETLPEDVREMVILARQSKESKQEEIPTKKR